MASQSETRQQPTALDLRSFGRRRGRKLSPRQQQLLDESLPRVLLDITRPAPAALSQMFTTAPGAERQPPHETWLEIGFGGAEHLIWQAERHPHVGIIGCEPFEEGVVKALSAIEERGLGNVRLHPDDARPLLRWLPPASLSRAFILFPDPWPKKRHAKRRLLNAEMLDLLARALAPGAELRVATDIGDYMRTLLIAFSSHSAFAWEVSGPSDWRIRPADWPATRYEQKALREGRRGYFFCFRRRGD